MESKCSSSLTKRVARAVLPLPTGPQICVRRVLSWKMLCWSSASLSFRPSKNWEEEQSSGDALAGSAALRFLLAPGFA